MSIAGQPGGVGGAVDEGDVQLGVGGRAGEGGGGVVAEPDGDAGVGAAEAGQQRRQVDHAEGLDRPDVQLAAQDAADTGHGVAAFVGRDRAPGGPRAAARVPPGCSATRRLSRTNSAAPTSRSSAWIDALRLDWTT